MKILINKAILHIIDNTSEKTYFSNEELDFESETCQHFIDKHIKKLLNDPNSKKATFNADSEVFLDFTAYKNKDIFFKEFSFRLVEKLSEIILKHVDIPSADILIVDFLKDDTPHIAILKLNYNHCYTHEINVTENKIDNQIVKYTSVLPFTSGKVEEACIIPFEPMVLKIIEKPHLVDGEPTYYFSQLFLDCETELSKKEAVEIIEDVNNQINNKYFNNNLDTLVTVNNALIEEAEEGEGILRLENVALKAFGENTEIKDEYVSLIRDSGIIKDLDLGEEYTRKQFGFQKFKADNGIELKFPAELTSEDDCIEFEHNSDGSVTIVLKNLRQK